MTIVAIVGPDGCGKTTQAKMLVKRLRNEGYEALYVRPVFILLNILTRSKDNDVLPISPRVVRTSKTNDSRKYGVVFFSQKLFMCLLGYPYALATFVFMKFYLNRTKIVVCDRYFYQFFYDLFGDWSENIIRIFPRPDITFFINGDLDIFYSRMDDSFDTLVSRGYYMDVLDLYRRVSKKYDFVQVDASLDEEVINDSILRQLIERCRL